MSSRRHSLSGPPQLSGTASTHELRQRVITCLNKLSDRDTLAGASLELESIARTLNNDSFSSFLSCIHNTDSSSKSPVRKQCVNLLSLLSRFHGDAMSPFISKMIATVLRRLRDPDSVVRSACVDAVAEMSSRITRPSFTVAFLRPFMDALTLEQDVNVQIGASLCLAAAIDAAPVPDVESLRRITLPRLGKLLKTDSCKAIGEASKEWGMFQILNHEIPNDVIRKLQSVGKEFFELPQEEKEVIAKPVGSNSIEGYGTSLQKEVNGKKGWVDHLFHIIWPPSSVNYRIWPNKPASYREVNEEYGKYLRGVIDKLFKSLSIGLGLKEHELKEAAGGDNMIHLLKINYYPPCPSPDLVLGVPPHTDMSHVTILVPNEVQGLQASRDGQWYDVKYVPNALVIHIGDQMEILSNGKYKAVLHRTTVNKEETRMSWPVFIEPQGEFEVGPHPKLINKENPPKFKTKKYKDYAYCKLNKIPQ